jgi:hypothetical protein
MRQRDQVRGGLTGTARGGVALIGVHLTGVDFTGFCQEAAVVNGMERT